MFSRFRPDSRLAPPRCGNLPGRPPIRGGFVNERKRLLGAFLGLVLAKNELYPVKHCLGDPVLYDIVPQNELYPVFAIDRSIQEQYINNEVYPVRPADPRLAQVLELFINPKSDIYPFGKKDFEP